MAERDNDLSFLIDLARGRFSRRNMLKASGALAAGAAIGGGLTNNQLADVSAQSPEAGAAPSDGGSFYAPVTLHGSPVTNPMRGRRPPS